MKTFRFLADYFDQIEKTTSRLEMTNLLAQLFNQLSEDEIDKTIYLLQGRVGPFFESVEIGLGEKLLIKAILKVLNIERNDFFVKYQEIGDLGKTVEFFKKKISSFLEKELNLEDVFKTLRKVALASGDGAVEYKLSKIGGLILSLDPLSCRYLIRISSGTLRLGFSDMTILDSLSWMVRGDKSLRGILEKAYLVSPDLGLIGKLLKKGGIELIKDIKPKIFTPILMMRAERLSRSDEIIKKIGRCIVERKYDGFRLQCHLEKHESSKVKIFSRSLEEVSSTYPDLVEGLIKEIPHKVRQIIFEGEAVGWDEKNRKFLPFQETVQRKRKYQVEIKSKEIPLKLFVFDILYLNGNSLINTPFIHRRKLMQEIFLQNEGDSKILLAEARLVESSEEIDNFFKESISSEYEGIIAKKIDGFYQPGARNWNWIKLKKSYSKGLVDTIDCLVLGYDIGKGKRAKFGIGAFLVGIYNKEKSVFETIAKIGTGLKDEDWLALKKEADLLVVREKPKEYIVDKLMTCDRWLLPKLVVEIRADEITRSPVHTAGRKLELKKSGEAFEVVVPGFALRFPRLERFRPDKNPESITTLSEIEDMFLNQRQKH